MNRRDAMKLIAAAPVLGAAAVAECECSEPPAEFDVQFSDAVVACDFCGEEPKMSFPPSALQEFASECGKLLADDEFVEAGGIPCTETPPELALMRQWFVLGVKPDTVVVCGNCDSDDSFSLLSAKEVVDGFHAERAKGVVITREWEWPRFFVRYTSGGRPGWTNVCFTYEPGKA